MLECRKAYEGGQWILTLQKTDADYCAAIVRVAESQVGYLGKSSNANPDVCKLRKIW